MKETVSESQNLFSKNWKWALISNFDNFDDFIEYQIYTDDQNKIDEKKNENEWP